MGVSKNRGGPPKSWIFYRVFHEINHPFWGKIPLFWFNTQMLRIETLDRCFCFSCRTCHVQSWLICWAAIDGQNSQKVWVFSMISGGRYAGTFQNDGQILRDFCFIFETCCTCRHPPTSQVVSSFQVGVLHHQPLRHARAAIKAKRQGQGEISVTSNNGKPNFHTPNDPGMS